MQSNEVKEFYNSFLHSRMISYRLNNGNERINLASKFILENINARDNILEIGCGIGIITERISRKLKSGFIWACDISDKNIWYAKQTIRKMNIDFFEADILEQFDIVKKRVNKPIDVFIFVDVLEHIPNEKHADLFSKLDSISTDDAKILLTFPSEFYQNYLIKNNPNELQIVDEVITIDSISENVRKTGFVIKYIEFKDVWMTNQYVHCMLQRKQEIMRLQTKVYTNIFARFLNKLQRYYRKGKYINKVFKSGCDH